MFMECWTRASHNALSKGARSLRLAAGKATLCSYLGPGMQHFSRIDEQVVGTRLAPRSLQACLLPSAGIPGHQTVCFDLDLWGTR